MFPATLTKFFMDKIIVDSDALIAQLIESDSNHQKSLILNELIEKTYRQYILDITIAETASVLSRRFSQELAVRFLNQIDDSDSEIIYFDEFLFRKTSQLFKSYSKKNISFVDSANLVITEELHIPKIFSFDSIYGEKRVGRDMV